MRRQLSAVHLIFVYCLCQTVSARVVTQGSGFEESTFSGNVEIGSGSGDFPDNSPSTCTSEYEQEIGHTMCLTDDVRVTRSGVSEEQKRKIVKYHNDKRASVQPPATDLTTMEWDDKLAAVAEKWAKQCIVDHDKNRDIPSYGLFIGQNVAAGYRKWMDAMSSWFDEVKLYRYGEDANEYLGPGGWREIGHYTQMVQNTTSRVGCGYAECSDSPYGRYYVCNYARGQSRTRYPYTSGERCSACPDSCKNGLCDCKGKLCLHGGKLDINTCTCTCQNIYKGDDCGQLSCPDSDAFYCRRDLLPRDCEIYANVPVLCPYMCGLCGTKNISQTGQAHFAPALQVLSPTTTPTPEFISPHNCTYRGMRSSPAECKSFGDEGSDTQFCESRGGKFTCRDCDRYYNVKRDYCPVMCGICDAPCGGKECLNDGRLNTDTCLCSCKAPFSGDTCEKLSCPETDKWHCQFFNAEFCSLYSNVPTDCPYLCGICA